MGISYLTDGDFMRAGIGVVLIDLLLMAFFIGAQLFKGTDEKFKRRIIFERILFFAAPIVYCFLMFPYAHFWTVFERRSDIESTFASSLRETKGMFDSYQNYSNTRIREYDLKLARDKSPQISRDNKVNALKLQLESDNFINLKNASYQWIDRATKATVWNVFMLGNIHKIKQALKDWNQSLTSLSSKTMEDEPEGVAPFTDEDASVIKANTELATLTNNYVGIQAPTWVAILSGLFLMLMLYCPYIIQGRNTKSKKRLIGTEGTTTQKKHIKKHSTNSTTSDLHDSQVVSDDENDILSFKM